MAKPRKMLNNWEAPYIQALIRQIETQSKTTLATWAIDYSEDVLVPIWNKHFPGDRRPISSIYSAREWLSGRIKLPEAKRVILLCHQAAREADGVPSAQAAARAIGQSASTIHSARHCIGLPLYGALAVAYDRIGSDAKWETVEKEAADECERMLRSLRLLSRSDEKNPAKITWHC
ncbi:MAG: hypothetical protein GXY06_00040 [Clostridiaceae bacterium]|nr:hypothetical protein [Clostridiaceae bacterium]